MLDSVTYRYVSEYISDVADLNLDILFVAEQVVNFNSRKTYVTRVN